MTQIRKLFVVTLEKDLSAFDDNNTPDVNSLYIYLYTIILKLVRYLLNCNK